jgi:hypothetical protein
VGLQTLTHLTGGYSLSHLDTVVHLQIQAYESSTVDRKEMIHKAGFVDPGQLTFSHGGVWWVALKARRDVNSSRIYSSISSFHSNFLSSFHVEN